MEHQDWKPVVWRKKTTIKNTHVHNPEGTSKIKILESEDPETHVTVSFEVKIKIQKARTAKKMTQKQLAHRINVHPSVISSYESGKAIPNASILRKIGSILGVKL